MVTVRELVDYEKEKADLTIVHVAVRAELTGSGKATAVCLHILRGNICIRLESFRSLA